MRHTAPCTIRSLTAALIALVDAVGVPSRVPLAAANELVVVLNEAEVVLRVRVADEDEDEERMERVLEAVVEAFPAR